MKKLDPPRCPNEMSGCYETPDASNPAFSPDVGLVALGLCMAGFAPAPAKTAISAQHKLLATDAPVRYMYPEVRLRKLHLVRPDLIPYPIEYEVYC